VRSALPSTNTSGTSHSAVIAVATHDPCCDPGADVGEIGVRDIPDGRHLAEKPASTGNVTPET